MHSNIVYMSLYKIHEDDLVYPAHEPNAVPFNAGDILNSDCLREVYAHPFENTNMMCVSPNNAAFYMGFTRPVISFFGCCVVTYMKDYGRLMIALYLQVHSDGRHTVILDWNTPLTEHLSPLLNEARLAIVHSKRADGNFFPDNHAHGRILCRKHVR